MAPRLRGRAANTADATVAHVAAMVLGGGMSSRLFQALREDRGLVYDTSAFHWAIEDIGLFGIHFATDARNRRQGGRRRPRRAGRYRRDADRRGVRARQGAAARRAPDVARKLREPHGAGRALRDGPRAAPIQGGAAGRSRRVDAAAVRNFIEVMSSGAPTVVAIGADAAPHQARIRSRFGAPVRGAA